MFSPPRFLDSGEAALVVELGSEVDPAVHDRVLALDSAIAALKTPGILETVPTYRSLLLHYDPLVLSREALIECLLPITLRGVLPRQSPVRWTFPCCYEPPYGEEIAQVAATLGLTIARVARLHSQTVFRLYMYGFAPGSCYLGGLPPELAISRRPTPRPPHPPGAILIAGGLSLISTFSMPTGWWIVGRTPERSFSASRNPMFLAQPGDEVRFEPVSEQRFRALELRAAEGEVIARREQR